jgi:hypothetical protein
MKPEPCDEHGDFGHPNVWGTPYLMFGVRCSLAKDHRGPHAAQHEINIKPSFEKDGLKINKSTVVVSPATITIKWENN